MENSLYDFKVNRIDGKPSSIADFRGKVLMFVNVASKCGLTPQYEALERIYEKYRAQGFEVLAFPANNFLGQEPDSNEEIAAFCQASFGVKFPLFEKISVKGQDQSGLYKFLTKAKPNALVKAGSDFEQKLKGHGQNRENPADVLWNFEKFIVDRNGKVIARYSPDIAPDDPIITKEIEIALSH